MLLLRAILFIIIMIRFVTYKLQKIKNIIVDMKKYMTNVIVISDNLL